MTKRKICVVTGTRAEYGLLYWLLRAISEDEALELQLIVTGTHLSPQFGLTYRIIEQDGFTIDAKVEMLLAGDTPGSIARSMGVEMLGLAGALERIKPDLMVILGDRYEMLAAAQAALIFNVPIAHLHGGETTEGAIDEGIRHAITKMAALHFPSNAVHARRIRQMGENPTHIHEVGAVGLDNIFRLSLLTREELSRQIDFPLGEKFFLVTYHPVTVREDRRDALGELLAALDEFPAYRVLITKANSDAGGRNINERLEAYAAAHPTRVVCQTSLGQLRYLSAVKHAVAVIGNSSSGLIEAPALHTPTVNIGDRQKGRERELSVIDSGEEKSLIVAAINQALAPEFRNKVEQMTLPHFDGNISQNIKNILRDTPLNSLRRKHFFSLNR